MLTLLLLLSAWTAAAAEPEHLARACEAYEDRSLHELSWTGAWVKELTGKLFSSSPEDTFLTNHLDSLFVLRKVACESWALSYSICARENEGYREIKRQAVGEEADAIRHFLLSATLTCSRGARYAELFLVSHEGKPELWNDRSEMDIANNYVGIDWARQAGNCQNVVNRGAMARIAVRLLREGKLKTLRNGKTACGEAGRPEEALFSQLGRQPLFLREIQAKNARACGSAN